MTKGTKLLSVLGVFGGKEFSSRGAKIPKIPIARVPKDWWHLARTFSPDHRRDKPGGSLSIAFSEKVEMMERW
jgi:hypothetical protein